jgi:hypothetical protein
MKKLIIITLLFLVSSVCLASDNLLHNSNISKINSSSIEKNKGNVKLDKYSIILTERKNNDILGKCSIKVNITLENGTIIKGKVTFHDVGFFECIGIKAANLWSKIF